MNLTPVPQVLLQLPQEPQFFQEEFTTVRALKKCKSKSWKHLLLAFRILYGWFFETHHPPCMFFAFFLCSCTLRCFLRIWLCCSLYICTATESKYFDICNQNGIGCSLSLSYFDTLMYNIMISSYRPSLRDLTPLPHVLLQLLQEPQPFQDESTAWIKLKI